MNEQPEALRLADELAIQDQCDFYKVCEEAALELRWLHEENERLCKKCDELGSDKETWHNIAELHLATINLLKTLMLEAVAAEREACAKVAESYEPTCDTCPSGVANAIRARGEQEQPK